MFIFQNINRCFNQRKYVGIFSAALIISLFFYAISNFSQELPKKSSASLRSHQKRSAEMASAAKRLTSVDFEVFGVVQGVFFRKYTQKEATRLGLVGWVQNTRAGTVVGVVQGPDNSVAQMKTWLASKGSPKSKIDRCDTKNERDIAQLEFSEFDVVREKGDTKPRKKKVVTKTKVK